MPDDLDRTPDLLVTATVEIRHDGHGGADIYVNVAAEGRESLVRATQTADAELGRAANALKEVVLRAIGGIPDAPAVDLLAARRGRRIGRA